ncbi:MAG: D-glycero-beta-D-manno-heptose-7-phosphate kinase [Elusimicrobiales bacterium]|nr:D-glycero-beta-D-manno-heptose-7-phosphate kinase [Elusimicrobiales bacterium]
MDKIDRESLIKTIDGFNNKRIAVIGDVILDKYVFGKVRRISPEAPVPVLEIENEKTTFGGAGNVANNISELGAKCYLVSVIGRDDTASELISLLNEKKNIDTGYIVQSNDQKTIKKTRIVAEHQQIVRVDREIKFSYSQSIKNKFISSIDSVIKNGIDAIILSDYGKGVLSKEIINYSIGVANKNRIPIFVDPKIEHFFSYKKITSMTPNIMEAFAGMRMIESREQSDIENIGRKILRELSLKSLIITQSEQGMTVFDNFKKSLKITHIPTNAKEVYDVTGAGDTVISVLALGYSVSKDILLSSVISNYAAGIVVGKLGTATASVNEIKEAIKNENSYSNTGKV